MQSDWLSHQVIYKLSCLLAFFFFSLITYLFLRLGLVCAFIWAGRCVITHKLIASRVRRFSINFFILRTQSVSIELRLLASVFILTSVILRSLLVLYMIADWGNFTGFSIDFSTERFSYKILKLLCISSNNFIKITVPRTLRWDLK